jgi:diaminopimelate epimerase
MRLPFVKFQGAGNDFVLIDCFGSPPPSSLPELARALCDRRRGIGADGLLIALPSEKADFRMQIFNADGSEPTMCGNGIRCLVDYLQKRQNASESVTIETGSGILSCRKEGEEIAVNLGAPSVLHFPIELDGKQLFVLNTGVPHAVIFVDAIDQVDLKKWGPYFRFHPQFVPEGVNVNFAQLLPSGQIAVRTYERGVEGETLACGTGAAAVAYAAWKLHSLLQPVTVLTTPPLRFFFPKDNNGIHAIEMVGAAVQVFEGLIECASV